MHTPTKIEKASGSKVYAINDALVHISPENQIKLHVNSVMA